MSQIKLRYILLACCAVFLQNCVDREIFDAVPDVASRPDTGKTWPDLVPSSQFDRMSAEGIETAKSSQEEARKLELRVQQLRRKAARLRGPILSRAERAELQAALEPQ